MSEPGGNSLIKVRQKRIDEDVFMEMRKEVLAVWPTGREVDLEEAVEYQRSLPDSKRFHKILERIHKEGPISLFPRQGTPLLEDEIKLVQSLNELGIHLLPLTTDSYTRNLELEKVEKGLEETRRTGKPALNGYPIINYGVKNNRKLVEACDGALDPRSSRVGQRLVAEIAFASGMNAFPNSFFGWIAGYDKKATVEECIETAQYTARLIGYYADHGVIITTDCHGWLPNFVIPMSVNMATQIIEALVSAEQGVKSVFPQVNIQGCLVQDLADMRVLPRLMREYLDRFGYTDVMIPGVFGSQSPLYPFPQELGSAFGYIGYTAMTAALGGVDVCSVKTVDEAAGVPTMDAHLESYRAAMWVFGVMHDQKIEVNDPAIKREEEIAEAEVRAILDKVIELGDGDIVVGTVKAVAAGVLDSPFSINIHAQDKVMGIRDLEGITRYIEFGNLPIPEEIKEFHRQRVAEREKAEGRKLDYYAAIEDFWAISRGRLKGVPKQ
ncbi:MAG: methylaspartate mutase subunit E [Thermoleophilia bacterium]|nr:methylaspartate mutase subunit E [Thermoleophilia bacterium]